MLQNFLVLYFTTFVESFGDAQILEEVFYIDVQKELVISSYATRIEQLPLMLLSLVLS